MATTSTAVRVTGVTPASNAPIIVLPSATELALLNSPHMGDWWRADSGFDPTGWVSRKSGLKLTPITAGALSLVNGDLGMPAVRRTTLQGSGNVYSTLMAPVGSTTWPLMGGYTFAWVAKLRSDLNLVSSGAIVSNDVQSGAFTGYSTVNFPTRFQARHANSVTISDDVITPMVPKAILWSYDYGDSTGSLMNSAGSVLLPVTNANTNVPTSGRISLFGNRNESGSFISNGGFNGDLYDLVILKTPIHKNDGLKSLLVSYLAEKYAGKGI